MEKSQSPGEVLSHMLGGYWISQALHVAGELGIADELSDGPLTVAELASRVGADPDGLYRALRALASVGVFAEDGGGAFSLTPLADGLRSDVEGSQRSFARMMGAEFYQAWGRLLHSVRTGGAGFDEHYGQTFFDYMARHPDRHAIYDEAMNGIHGVETDPMLDAYDFSACSTVVDVGGGNGLTLIGVLERFPGVKGILFDLPQVAGRARSMISQSNLQNRCSAVEGDFFVSVPGGADVYILRHVIHDWQDDQAVRILRNCRDAMGPNGAILVVENVIAPANMPCFGKWLDLMMLLVGGRERTEQQYRQLFSRAGLTLDRILSTTAEISIIKGRRAS